MKVKQYLTKDRLLNYGKNSVMGIQHLFAMMGATILVPILCNMSVSIGLISAGVGTLIFFFVTKKKVPVFLGSSFAFMTALQSQIPAEAAIGSSVWNFAMAQMSIAIICTGLVYVLLSLLIKLVGTGFIRKLFPPVVVGPVIIVIGMCLANVAIDNMRSTTEPVGYAVTGIVTAAVIIAFSVFAKGFFKVIPILIGIVAGYITAVCFGIVDFTIVKDSAWVLFQPSELKRVFGWYSSLGDIWNKELITVIFAFVPIAIVTFMEHLGDINASSIVCGKDFVKDPGIHRTLLGDGLATMAAGFIGGPCNTTYGENTAVLAITKNYNPRLLALAAIFAIILGVFSKFGGLIGTIPAPVIGGASLILYGMIAANGLKTMVEAKVDFSDSKNMIICSLILVIGIGMKVSGVTLDIGKLKFSPLAVATFVGIIINVIFMLAKGKRPSGISGTYGNLDVTQDEQTNDDTNADSQEEVIDNSQVEIKTE